MIISHKHKFIFLKTRKTAGSSIEKYLINYLGPNDICTGSAQDNTPRLNTKETNGHRGWKWIAESYPNEWKSYYKFAVERNPWDKIVSAYFYYKSRKPKKVSNGFESFVRGAKDQNDWNLYALKSDIQVDNLIDYSKLHEEFLEIPVPYNNELLRTFVKSDTKREKDYTKMYNNETKDIVAKRFSNVIDYFGYTF
jgi:hypothetical protein